MDRSTPHERRFPLPPRLAVFAACLLPACRSGDLDGVASEGHYVLAQSSANAYQDRLVPALFQPWAEDLVQRAELRAGERVLDLACGTGVVARVALPLVGARGAVTGLDLSPGMLGVARRIPTQPAIRYVEGNAMALPFADGSFDVVLCQEALQFFPDPHQALREIHRVLVPGGRVLLSVWRGLASNPYGAAVADAVEAHMGRAAGDEARSPFAEDVGVALAGWLKDAGFEQVESEVVRIDLQEPDLADLVHMDLCAYPTAGAAFRSLDEDRRRELVEDAVQRMTGLRNGALWSIPFEAWVGAGRRPD